MKRMTHDLLGKSSLIPKWDLRFCVWFMMTLAGSAAIWIFITFQMTHRVGLKFIPTMAAMIVICFIFLLRVYLPNRSLHLLYANWSEWRLAGIPPSRVLWAFTKRNFLIGATLSIILIAAIGYLNAPYWRELISVPEPDEDGYAQAGAGIFWVILAPIMFDIVYMFTAGVFLDVAQWPRRHAFIRRIIAQIILLLSGSVVFIIGSQFFEDFTGIRYLPFDPQLDHSLGFFLALTLISMIIRTWYITHQWRNAIAILNAEIAPPFQ